MNSADGRKQYCFFDWCKTLVCRGAVQPAFCKGAMPMTSASEFARRMVDKIWNHSDYYFQLHST